jgi:hypothetical protein
MILLGKVAKAADILKLDKIVERRVEQYDRRIGEIIEKLDRIYYENEVVAIEHEVMEICLAKYDEEAVPYIDRHLNSNWRGGGGGNLEVRKRMLLRELEKRRFKLFEAVEQKNKLLRDDLQRYLDVTYGFIQDSLPLLPLSLNELQTHFSLLGKLLDALARETSANNNQLTTYPKGHLEFDFAVHGELVTEMGKAFSSLITRNEELSRQLHRQRLQYYLDFLQSFESDTEANLLPMAPIKLCNHLETFNPLLEAKVMTHYKEGMNSFDSLVGGELTRKIREAFERLKLLNARCTICAESFPDQSKDGCYCSSEKHFTCWNCFQDYLEAAKQPDAISSYVDRDGHLTCSSCKRPYDIVELAASAPKEIAEKLFDLKVFMKVLEERQMIQKEEKEIMKKELAKFQNMDAFDREVELLRKQIIDEIFTLRCPRCSTAFIDFDGCFALTCGKPGCNCGFCAWCLVDCGADAHGHVANCDYNSLPEKPVFGDVNELKRIHNMIRSEKITDLLRDKSIQIKGKLKEIMTKDFEDLNLPMDF